ncbi:hypothetical protein Y032_0041g417 [Ancylostoma ceylanicum]|uniref:Uncharacterized protein n=1 Tax=Ancylostoma ceylanicum TaxID=53326 RepID=A0A016UHC3_9BILA|nr:hypothetical protein Y032_0041g417 [Ancylostoma ceylanicum]
MSSAEVPKPTFTYLLRLSSSCAVGHIGRRTLATAACLRLLLWKYPLKAVCHLVLRVVDINRSLIFSPR